MKIASVKVSVPRVTPDTAYEAGGRTVDATETWDLATAMKTGQALQEVGIRWLKAGLQIFQTVL